MATRKITITVDEDQLDRIRKIVGDGQARSVSGFVQDAVTRTLDAQQLFGQHLETIIADSGGPANKAEAAWLNDIFGEVIDS